MSRIISVKVSYPTPCSTCERTMQINEWATAKEGGDLVCSRCTEKQDFTINEQELPY